MIIVANMVESLCPNQIADNAVARRTAKRDERLYVRVYGRQGLGVNKIYSWHN